MKFIRRLIAILILAFVTLFAVLAAASSPSLIVAAFAAGIPFVVGALVAWVLWPKGAPPLAPAKLVPTQSMGPDWLPPGAAGPHTTQTASPEPKSIGSKHVTDAFDRTTYHPLSTGDWSEFAVRWKTEAKAIKQRAAKFTKVTEQNVTMESVKDAAELERYASAQLDAFEKEYDTLSFDSEADNRKAGTLHDVIFDAEGAASEAFSHVEDLWEIVNDPDY